MRYVETIRERIWLVIAAVIVATGAAGIYVLTAAKTYEARAELLVTPVSSTSAPLLGLPLIRASSDPTRDVETAAGLITDVDVADRVGKQLNLHRSGQSILSDVSAAPIAQSNLVAVTATAASATGASDLANTFARQAVKELTAQLHQQLDLTIRRLKAGAPHSAKLRDDLTGLRQGPNPNLSVSSLARTPTAPSSPRTKLSIAAGLIAGLILGIAAAFASQVLDPRLRREEQLRRLFRLPILGRIPIERRQLPDKPLGPFELSPATSEAYRTLRATLAMGRGTANPGSQSSIILVTGSSPSEGKSTTAMNLAASLTAAGKSVILIEADLRRPALGEVLGIEPKKGIASVVVHGFPLRDALVTTTALGPKLGFLLADSDDAWASEVFALPTARNLLEEARRLADYVVIDTAPLTDVVDALPLAVEADQVLIVARLGKTRVNKLTRLAELLATDRIKPAGLALIGTHGPRRRDDYYYYLRGHPRRAASIDAGRAPDHDGEPTASFEASQGARERSLRSKRADEPADGQQGGTERRTRAR